MVTMVKASNLLGDPSHQRRARSIGKILPDIARPFGIQLFMIDF